MPHISVPLGERTPDDLVVRFGEKFTRGEIDRGINQADFLFGTLGCSETEPAGYYPENTPSYIATEIARATGRVAIADIGCGTGHTLLSWGCKIAEEAPCNLSQVSMTGISLRDYSGESASAATVQLQENPPSFFRYLTGDAQRMPEIETDSQDVTLALYSALHGRADRWLREMTRITRPGGTILFNVRFNQAKNGQPLPCMLTELESKGWKVLINNLIIRAMSPQTALKKRRPTGDEITLYRLDAPS